MKINFSHVLTNLYRAPLKLPDGKDMTLGAACAECLVSDLPGEAPGSVSGVEKVRRYKLAQRLVEGGESDLSAEDIVLLKDALPKGWPPMVAGQAIEILDPASAAPR